MVLQDWRKNCSRLWRFFGNIDGIKNNKKVRIDRRRKVFYILMPDNVFAVFGGVY